ncbi:MAG: VCBS repeat-containing protein [Planctomycetes bacterium]|nr:VCBS repeat-containing protein [Planctomycetota bacterium]
MSRHFFLRIGCGLLAVSGVTAFAQGPPAPPSCSGTFHKSATYTVLPELRPAGVAIGDIDRDGWLDVVVVTGKPGLLSEKDVHVFRNTQDWATDPPTSGLIRIQKLDVEAFAVPHRVALGDLNEDGWLDIVVTGDFRYAAVYFYDPVAGEYPLSESRTVDFGITGSGQHNPGGVLVCDLDQDGNLDVVVAGSFSSVPSRPMLGVAWGPNDWVGEDPTIANFVFSSELGKGFDITTIGLCASTDAILDLALTNSEQARLHIARNQGDRTFIFNHQDGVRSHGIAATSFDSDGLIDLACTATFPDRVVWFKNLGLGDFQAQPPDFQVAALPWGIAAGQLDGIHRADLVTVNANGGFALTENISVLLHNGTTPPTVSRSDYLVNGQTLQRHYIALGDLDRNGCLDVVTSNNLSHDITVLLNLP